MKYSNPQLKSRKEEDVATERVAFLAFTAIE